MPGARKFTELGVHEKKAMEKLDSIDPVPRMMVELNEEQDVEPPTRKANE